VALDKQSCALAVFVLSAILGAVGPSRVAGAPPPSWAIHVREVDDALTRGDAQAAVRAWRDAHGAALASEGWDGLLEVGDAYRRLGEVARSREPFEAGAREIYLTAFSRARRQQSLDGVLRAAEAFAALGDRALVEQSLRVAEALAAGDPEAEADVGAFVRRWAGEPPARGD